MFAISSAGIPRIDTYADALRFHDKAAEKPWPSGGEDYPFPNKRYRQYGVRKLADGSVVFRYHSTDVVTWHPDDSCTLRPWNSLSTQTFASPLLPKHVWLTGSCTKLVQGDWKEGWIYPLGHEPVRIGGPDDAIITGMKFEKERVDRKAAKVVLARTRYAEYRNWYQLMAPMLMPGCAGGYVSSERALELLANPEDWHELMTAWSNAGRPDTLRKIIYENHRSEVYYTEYFDRLPVSALRGSKLEIFPA